MSEELRLLATAPDFHAPGFYRHAWSRKLQTQLAQHAPRDPACLAALIEAVRANTKAPRTVYEPLDAMPLLEVRRRVSEEIERLRGLDGRGAQKLWAKHREMLERACAIDDTLATIEHFAKSTEPLPRVLNLAAVLLEWRRCWQRPVWSPLPSI